MEEDEGEEIGVVDDGSHTPDGRNPVVRSKDVWQTDVLHLLGAFEATADLSFASFKAVWKRLSFSAIHHARPSHQPYSEYLQSLYSLASVMFYTNDRNPVRVGLVYFMYTLYWTQRFEDPLIETRPRISVSIVTYRELTTFASRLKQLRDGSDCLHILISMVRNGLFAHTLTSTKFGGFAGLSRRTSVHVPSLTAEEAFQDSLSEAVQLHSLKSTSTTYAQAKALVNEVCNDSIPTVVHSPISDVIARTMKEWKQERARLRFTEQRVELEAIVPGPLGEPLPAGFRRSYVRSRKKAKKKRKRNHPNDAEEHDMLQGGDGDDEDDEGGDGDD